MSATLLQQLRDRRQALVAGRTIDLDVPGYDGDLVVRYRFVPYEELAAAGEALAKVKDPRQREVFAACDTLARCADEVFLRVGGELTPVSEDGVPVKFDDRLAEALGFDDPGSARLNVRETFACNDYAVIAQAIEVSAWLQDGEANATEEAAGNS